jgi:hypothetical protein
MVLTVGIDLGSSKTVLVADDGELVRTDTGSVAVPSLLAFADGSRYTGDEAASFPYGPGRLPLLPLAVRDAPAALLAPAAAHKAFFEHCPTAFQLQGEGEYETAVYCGIPYGADSVSLSAPALLAVLVGQHARRIDAVYAESPPVRLAFVLPHGAGPHMARNVMTGAWRLTVTVIAIAIA